MIRTLWAQILSEFRHESLQDRSTMSTPAYSIDRETACAEVEKRQEASQDPVMTVEYPGVPAKCYQTLELCPLRIIPNVCMLGPKIRPEISFLVSKSRSAPPGSYHCIECKPRTDVSLLTPQVT